MQTSKQGIDFIKKWEKFSPKPYLCQAGKWTIGYGTTVWPGYGKVDKDTPAVTQQQASDVMVSQIRNIYEPGVFKYLSTYKFSQSEFDALVSFNYNLGQISNLTKNGTHTKEQIAQKFKEYCLSKGKKSKGLVRRRLQEEQMFRKGIYDLVS